MRKGKSVPCTGCGKLIYRKPYELKKKKTHWCSKECRNGRKTVELQCEHCGKMVTRFASQVKEHTFCSKECAESHGRTEIPCIWPGCENVMSCRVMKRRKGGKEYLEYKTDLIKTGSYVKYPFCDYHRQRIKDVFGKGHRTNSIPTLITSPEKEYGARSISNKTTRFVVFELNNGRCSCCGKELDFFAPPKTWQVDHIIPIFKGGKTKLSNLTILCEACHDKKSAKEKSEATKERHSLGIRWKTHYEKDLIIAKLQEENQALQRQIKQFLADK